MLRSARPLRAARPGRHSRAGTPGPWCRTWQRAGPGACWSAQKGCWPPCVSGGTCRAWVQAWHTIGPATLPLPTDPAPRPHIALAPQSGSSRGSWPSLHRSRAIQTRSRALEAAANSRSCGMRWRWPRRSALRQSLREVGGVCRVVARCQALLASAEVVGAVSGAERGCPMVPQALAATRRRGNSMACR